MPATTQKKCKFCGGFFEPEFGRFNLRYCSEECKKNARKKRNQKYEKKNKEQNKLKSKEYYHNKIKKNPEIRKEFTKRSKKYREENIDKIRESQQKYYQANQKAIKKQRKEWWHKRGRKLAEARREGKKINLLKRGRPRIKK